MAMPKTIKPLGGGKRHPLNMRTTREVREQLAAAAAANGRSLAQEVETRLERSFYVDLQELMDAAKAGRKILAGVRELDAARRQLLDLSRDLEEPHITTIDLIRGSLRRADQMIDDGLQALIPTSDQEQEK